MSVSAEQQHHAYAVRARPLYSAGSTDYPIATSALGTATGIVIFPRHTSRLSPCALPLLVDFIELSTIVTCPATPSRSTSLVQSLRTLELLPETHPPRSLAFGWLDSQAGTPIVIRVPQEVITGTAANQIYSAPHLDPCGFCGLCSFDERSSAAMATMVQTMASPVVHTSYPISPLVTKMKQQFLTLDIPLPAIPLLQGHTAQFNQPTKPHPYPAAEDAPELTTWFLDTRTLWPGEHITTAAGAVEALKLVSEAERKTITTKMFIADAKMSLGSALLKRAFICKTLGITWKDVKLARKGNEKHGKPCAVDGHGRPIEGIDFNVSHQNGLVALVGWDGRRRHRYSPSGHIQGSIRHGLSDDDVMVGVDIVCVNERESAQQTIDLEGFDGWVDIYDAVFSDEERWDMKYNVDRVTLLDGTVVSAKDLGRNDRCLQRNKSLTCVTAAGKEHTFSSELLIDAKLRRFYTYFCYKEAYIKLAGEALLAPWLKQLEFFNVRSPRPGTVARCSTHGQWGEEVDDVEVKLHGKIVDDVRMKIQSFEEDFLISCAIQGNIDGLTIPAFQRVDVASDILIYANDGIERKDSFVDMIEVAKAAPELQCPDHLLSPWESRYW